MCGICGILALDGGRPIDAAVIRRMTDTLQHRGPNSSGYHVAPGVGLGVRRLSIVDLETGDQPIANEDESIVLVCNGEIYNHVELREQLLAAGHRFRTKSDTEVIVHLYEDHGVDCLQQLRGMFAFALWDARKQRLFLARDRFGIKPLYYAVSNDSLLFGSEAKAILASGQIDGHLDPHALKDLFGFGFVAGAKTLFSSVRQLPPGHFLLCAEGRTSIKQYWDMRFPPRTELASRSEAEWADELQEQLRESVRLHMRSDVPVGSWLSGGLDSSAITSLMREWVEPPVKTFGVRFEDPRCDELGRVATLDRFPGYDLAHSVTVCRDADFARLPEAIWHAEEPTAFGLEIPRLLLSESTARSVKVIAAGEGADEMLGGYRWFQWEKLLRPLAALPLAVRKLMLLGPLLSRLRPGLARRLLAPAEMRMERYRSMHHGCMDSLPGLLSGEWKRQVLSLPNDEDLVTQPDGFEHWHPFNQLQYYDIKIRLPGFLLPLVDRPSMAYSVEARVPFLDHKLAEFCARIPPSLKMKRFREKYVLRRAVEDALPREIAWRPKFGMTAPWAQWAAGKLPSFAEDLLSERTLRATGYFDPRAVSALRKRVGARHHRSSSRQLMTVLIVQVWDQLFLRNARI